MENITIGQVAIGLAFLVGLIGSIEFLCVRLKKSMTSVISKEIKPLKDDIESLKLSHKNDKIDCIKTDLVNFMSLAENETISTEQKINAHELMDEYTRMGGNSYIHDKWDKLIKEDKL